MKSRRAAVFSFQPTLPARGATGWRRGSSDRRAISTHAPRTGSDTPSRRSPGAAAHFNPRSPHGERRLRRGLGIQNINFNPRSPHGERRQPHRQKNSALSFQPTLPARGATRTTGAGCWRSEFQPTLPARGATDLWSQYRFLAHFNPRSPHGERRAGVSAALHSGHNFNPRSPHGERRCRSAPSASA